MLSLVTVGLMNTATAANIYSKNGFTYKVNGDWQVQLRDDYDKDVDLNIEFDDLEVKNHIHYELSDNLTAFGELTFDFSDAAEGENEYGNKLTYAYVGMQWYAASIAIGMQDYATDDFGIEEAYEMNSDKSAFDEQGTNGDDVIRLDIKQEFFAISLSTEIESEGSDSEDGESFDVLVSTSFKGLEVMAAYQSSAQSIDEDRIDAYGMSIAYDANFITLAADYSQIEDGNTIYNVASTINPTEALSIAVGYVVTEPDSIDDTDVEISEWYTNITYKFPAQKNVRLFAEIAQTDEEDDDEELDLNYVAGIRLKF